ncbi:MAG TPA: hypothetical protein VF735_10655 [Pyrinomonadaceae bacterium]
MIRQCPPNIIDRKHRLRRARRITGARLALDLSLPRQANLAHAAYL